MSEFNCPFTGEPCATAQTLEQVLYENASKMAELAILNVTDLGYFANASMNIDRDTTTDVMKAIRLTEESEPGVMGARLREAIEQEVQQVLVPGFLFCMADLELEVCAVDASNSDRLKQLTVTSLSRIFAKVVEKPDLS